MRILCYIGFILSVLIISGCLQNANEEEIYHSSESAAPLRKVAADAAENICVAPDNIIGWWSFDNMGQDYSGFHFDAISRRDTYWNSGFNNQNYESTPISGYLEVPDHEFLDVTSSVTMEAWININSYTFWPGIIGKGDFANYQASYGMFLTPEGNISSIINTNGTSTGRAFLISGVIPLNTWTHVVTTYDGSYLRIYVNGIISDSLAHVGELFVTNSNLYMGVLERHGIVSAEVTFDGYMDEITLYDKALSGSEIYTAYNAQSYGKCKDSAYLTFLESKAQARIDSLFILRNTCRTPSSSLIGWWSFDNMGEDNSGYHFDATSVRDTYWNTGFNIQNYESTPTSGYLEVSDHEILDVTSSVTMEAWINIRSYTNWPGIIGKGDFANYQASYGMFLTPEGNISAIINTNGTSSGRAFLISDVIPLNTWSHVVTTYDGNYLKIYVNGVMTSSLYHHGELFITSSNLYMGVLERHGSVSSEVTFDGFIDEVSLYNTALSKTDIYDDYMVQALGKCKDGSSLANLQANAQMIVDSLGTCSTPTSGLKGWWAFDNNIFDISGYEMNGISEGEISWGAGYIEQSFVPSPSAQYIQVPNNPNLNYLNEITVEAWVNTDSYAGYAGLVSKGDVATYNESFSFQFTPSGNISVLINSNGLSSGRTYLVSNVVPTKQWTHLAFTYDGSMLNIYINGVLTSAAPHANGIHNTGNDLYIGIAEFFGDVAAQPKIMGKIDEVSFYDRALSNSEILNIYTANQNGKCKDLVNPIEQAVLDSIAAAEEQARIDSIAAAEEQAKQDSIAEAEEQARQDSMAAAEEQARLDSIATAEEQARLDSIAAVEEQARQDSINNVPEYEKELVNIQNKIFEIGNLIKNGANKKTIKKAIKKLKSMIKKYKKSLKKSGLSKKEIKQILKSLKWNKFKIKNKHNKKK